MPGIHLCTRARLPETRRRRAKARARASHNTAKGLSIVQSWVQWQNEVVEMLGAELEESLHHVSLDDIDWTAWRNFYLEGRSPRAAVDRALERDL